ncbi:MAG: histidine kinase [Saprospiraceae bacterium]|nr:histidine kinase [Saprospiraceae bacterium]
MNYDTAKNRWWRELIFFIVIFIGFPLLTDIEYLVYEKDGQFDINSLLPMRLTYGILGGIPYYFYYRWITPYLFLRRYLKFGLLVFLFLWLFHWYTKGEYWLISQLRFLPEQLIDDAKRLLEFNPRIFYFSIIYVLRELILVTVLAYYLRYERLEDKILLLDKSRLEAEVAFLKMQIQPHYYFNTLNHIYALAIQKSELTPGVIAKHADIMRHILYDAQNTWVSLAQEATFIKNFMMVESLRYEDRIEIRMEVQGVDKSQMIAPLLLLPFVENAFKHGLASNNEHGLVYLTLCVFQNEMIFELENSLSETFVTSPEGIGLSNVKNRLNSLYPNHSLEVNNTEKLYKVSLTINLQQPWLNV